MNGREIADRFELAGELIYIVGSSTDEATDVLARITRAASGRLIRCLRRCDGGIVAALTEAAFGDAGASASPDECQRPAAYMVSIRRDDRERFEETVSGVYARWIGETTSEKGLSLAPSASSQF